jgi:hypothetical protein
MHSDGSCVERTYGGVRGDALHGFSTFFRGIVSSFYIFILHSLTTTGTYLQFLLSVNQLVNVKQFIHSCKQLNE